MRQRLASAVKEGMEFSFTPIRTAILVVLLVAFWLLGGFAHLSDSAYVTGRAWIYSILIFMLGALMISVVDHWVGNLDRSNLRWLYVVMGVLLIGGSFMYQAVLRERLKIDKEALRQE